MVKKRTAMERLLSEGFFESREAALPYLMSGAVYCGAQPVTTGGQLVPGDRPMTVRGLYDRYVSKGGYKLEGAIRDFGIETQGRVCIDAGACTGGFTDCLVKPLFEIDDPAARRTVRLPAEERLLRLAVRRPRKPQMPLQRYGDAQLHRSASSFPAAPQPRCSHVSQASASRWAWA